MSEDFLDEGSNTINMFSCIFASHKNLADFGQGFVKPKMIWSLLI